MLGLLGRSVVVVVWCGGGGGGGGGKYVDSYIHREKGSVHVRERARGE